MKSKVIILTLVFATYQASGEESAFNLASRFEALPIQEQTMANLPKGRELDVINELSKYKGCAALLRLNHGPSVEYVTDVYLKSEGKTLYRKEIENSCSPYLVEKLAPALYKTDQAIYRRWGEGHTDYGQSAAATVLIGKLLEKSPEFSPEVKEWAKKYLPAPFYGSIANARKFIEVNQDALKAYQFDKVIVPPGPPFYPVSTEEAAESATKSDKKPQGDRAVTAEVIAPKQSETATNHGWLVGLLLAIGLSFFIVKKKA